MTLRLPLLASCAAFLSLVQPAAMAATAAEATRTTYAESVQPYLAHAAAVIALKNVTVIDGTATEPQPMQTIVIQDGWITAVGPDGTVEIPKQAEVLELAGRTVIPGLVGTHSHTHMPGVPILAYTAPRMYLASGVTTIQTTGSAAPYAEKDLAEHIRRGGAAGPDIIHSGPYFTGPGGSPVMITPRNREHIENVIRYWTGEGVTWFKVYRHVRPDDLRNIIDIAHAHGAKIAGHLCSVTYAEAADMGIDSIEHGFMHAMDFAADKPAGECAGNRSFRNELAIDSDAVREVQRIMIENGVSLSSTLAISEAQVPGRAIADERSLRAMSPDLRAAYEDRQRRMQEKGDDWYYKPHWLQKNMAFDVAYFRAGGLLTAGLDPGLHNLPGFGDQRNFELLVEAGLSVPEAIKVMTLNGAKSLELPDRGSIEIGKRADLVVLRGDLVKDPAAIRRVERVFKEGYGFDPAPLLEDVEGQVGLR